MSVMIPGSTGKVSGKGAREGKEANLGFINEQVIGVGVWGLSPTDDLWETVQNRLRAVPAEDKEAGVDLRQLSSAMG